MNGKRRKTFGQPGQDRFAAGGWHLPWWALDGLSVAAGVRYNGRSFGDNNNLYAIPSFTLHDAAIRYVINLNRPHADH